MVSHKKQGQEAKGYPAGSRMEANYTDDLALLANTFAQAKF